MRLIRNQDHALFCFLPLSSKKSAGLGLIATYDMHLNLKKKVYRSQLCPNFRDYQDKDSNEKSEGVLCSNRHRTPPQSLI